MGEYDRCSFPRSALPLLETGACGQPTARRCHSLCVVLVGERVSLERAMAAAAGDLPMATRRGGQGGESERGLVIAVASVPASPTSPPLARAGWKRKECRS